MKSSVTQECVDEIFFKAEKEVQTVFEKCTIMSCKLENGFILVESSACVDPKNYDFDMGIKICEEKIKNKIWELEGYLLQERR